MTTSQPGGLTRRLGGLWARRSREALAARLYAEAVARARAPRFYAEFHVPDTPAGRFEMLAWQVMIQLTALGDQGEAGRRLGQELVDRMFADMDRSLRELGVGDLSVGRQMRKLGETWQARAELAQTVLPNLDGRPTAEAVRTLAAFLQKNAGDENQREAVDGSALADDLLATLARLRGSALAGEDPRHDLDPRQAGE